MAVSAARLAAELGITVTDATDADDPGLVKAERLRALAADLVDAYLRGGSPPESIQDEAVIRTAGHMNHRTGFGIIEGRHDLTASWRVYLQPAAVNPLRKSGAAALLSPWVRRSA